MNNVVIRTEYISKSYLLYDKPSDRVAEALHPFGKKFHKSFYALRDVSFEIRKGETYGVIGSNGSGKSTLLKILAGVVAPTDGSYFVEGRVASLLSLGSGFNQELTGVDNIYFSGAIMGFSRKEMDLRLDEVVSFAEIGEFINQPVKTYSSGMFARLAFAVNMVLDPDIFIVDEALAVGDAAFVHRCMLRFGKMQQQGKTIIFVSHDMGMVKQLCSHALWLDKGVVMLDGDANLVADAYIRHMFNIPHRTETKDAVAEESVTPIISEKTERTIPHNDGKSGDQSVTFLGVGLYDERMNPIAVIENNRRVVLRVSVVNNTDHAVERIVVGYLIRNRLGVDFASCDTATENVDLGCLESKEVATIDILIHIPMLAPHDYSISPTAAYFDSNGDLQITDRIENAIVFKVTSSDYVRHQIKFITDFIRVE